MKENVTNNEKFVIYLEKNKARYEQNPDEVRSELEAIFDIDRHSLRAWISRLANPNKYQGKWAARIAPFKQGKKATAVMTNAPEQAAVLSTAEPFPAIMHEANNVGEVPTITAEELEQLESLEFEA